MNEFSLIDIFFKKPSFLRQEVVRGIGDDAACVNVPSGYQLLVSTDTLVSGVHFLDNWDAYDIAWKALMVNISDIAAMGGEPSWVTLALTLPVCDEDWLTRFSQGLHEGLRQYNMSLIGGDTTRGPLSITMTVHGLIPSGKATYRKGAKPGDLIWVSGDLGAAAQAVAFLNAKGIKDVDKNSLMNKLQRPIPRCDLSSMLQQYATAAIDISDGLSADLNHICEASQVGACLRVDRIPIHPLVKKYQGQQALGFALAGGDDYELCFTTSAHDEKAMRELLQAQGKPCFPIGFIETEPGLRALSGEGVVYDLPPCGYKHF